MGVLVYRFLVSAVEGSCFQSECRRSLNAGVTLDKARALYLVRVSELHVKSMYKIDRWGKGGVKKSYIRKFPLVLYKIDKKGGGSKNCLH